MFEDILGSYSHPNALKHDQYNKKSFIFIGDHWEEMGDIKYVVTQEGPDNATIHILVPDADIYAASHQQEGAPDWLQWGTQLN